MKKLIYSWMFRRCSDGILARTLANLICSWFSSVSAGKCWDITSSRPLLFPPSSYLVCYSSVILTFDSACNINTRNAMKSTSPPQEEVIHTEACIWKTLAEEVTQFRHNSCIAWTNRASCAGHLENLKCCSRILYTAQIRHRSLQ